jgi:hypothetical protein
MNGYGALWLNMSWHHPDLYFFLFLLAGLAAFLAIIYKCIQKFRRRKPNAPQPAAARPAAMSTRDRGSSCGAGRCGAIKSSRTA